MKPSTRFSAFASFSVCLFNVAQAQLHLPFSREVRNLPKTLLGRDSNPSLALWGGDYHYVVNASIGTPGQNVALVISPSSADTWVPDADSYYCNYTASEYYYSAAGEYARNVTYATYCLWGSYDSSVSSTYQRANSAYRSWTTYSPDSTLTGGYNFTDTLQIGDISVSDLPMGLADSSDQWIGSLGLGTNYSYYGNGQYDNFPDRLVKSGQIATKAYSIWLDDEAGTSGSLLMGAVDTSKYEGTLTRFDSYSSFYSAFGVSLTGLNISASSSAAAQALVSNEFPFTVSIGTGETLSNLPDVVAKKIWSAAGATYNASIYLATIPCDAATKATDGGARFAFRLVGSTGPVLDVRLSDLILPQNVAAERWADYSLSGAPSNTCLFAVQNGSTWSRGSSSSSSTYEYYNVGAALLRRQYMVFDLVNDEIALAPVKFGSTAAANVVAFAKYGASTPNATRVCTGDSCYQCTDPTTSSYRCTSSAGGGSSTGSGSGSGSGSDPGSDDPGFVPGMNVGLIAGLSVVFGLLTIVALLGAFALWRKVITGKAGKGGEENAELVGNPETGSSQASGAQAGQGLPAGALPAVREEMTETSREPPQLAPLPSEHVQASRWPLQGDSPVEEMSPQHPDPEVRAAAGEHAPAVDKRKGKEVATHEDH